MKYHFVHERKNLPPLAWEEAIDSASSTWQKTVGYNYVCFNLIRDGVNSIYGLEKVRQKSEKMKKGEILVVNGTTPDFMSALKMAKVVFINEGGLTSYAAIISRELKKPCIVGTKIATKVLKDGDLVEVDADKGVVRLIKT